MYNELLVKVFENLSDEQQELVDELVHDLKSKEASDINNAGPAAQYEYLTTNWSLINLCKELNLEAKKS